MLSGTSKKDTKQNFFLNFIRMTFIKDLNFQQGWIRVVLVQFLTKQVQIEVFSFVFLRKPSTNTNLGRSHKYAVDFQAWRWHSSVGKSDVQCELNPYHSEDKQDNGYNQFYFIYFYIGRIFKAKKKLIVLKMSKCINI